MDLQGRSPVPLRWEPVSAGRVAAHCVADYPREACGILVGIDSAAHRTIIDAIAVENVWDESSEQHRRFTIDPRQQLHIERSLEGTGRAVVGFYHSHPDAPAQPSAFDLEAAWPFYSYVIASVSQGRVVEMRSWTLDESNRHFVEQSIA